MVTAPTPIHTSNNKNGEPNALAIPAGVRKIPTAMIPPMTAAVVEPKPSCLFRPGVVAGVLVVDSPRLTKIVGTSASLAKAYKDCCHVNLYFDRSAIVQK